MTTSSSLGHAITARYKSSSNLFQLIHPKLSSHPLNQLKKTIRQNADVNSRACWFLWRFHSFGHYRHRSSSGSFLHKAEAKTTTQS
jgi:hypothetical protein